jgi:lactate dehydrogenase-like 2-hydroxyacid dehydrogenase
MKSLGRAACVYHARPVGGYGSLFAMKPPIVIVAPTSEELERALAERFELHMLGNAPDATTLPSGAREARVLVTSGTRGASRALIDSLPRLGLIAVHGVGLDKVDVEHARAKGIQLSTTPDVLTEDVADLAVGLVYAVLRRIVQNDRFVREGRWEEGERALLARRVTGRSIGILGLGRIGRAVAARLAPSAAEVIYHNRSRVSDASYRYVSEVRQLAAESDVLIITASGGPSSNHLVDATVLEALGPEGILINVARGSIVDEEALLTALREGRIAGAGLDVFANEPHVPADLLRLPTVVVQPHQGSATLEARREMARLVIAAIDAFVGVSC